MNGDVFQYSFATGIGEILLISSHLKSLRSPGYTIHKHLGSEWIVGTDSGILHFDYSRRIVVRKHYFPTSIPKANKVLDILPLSENRYLLASMPGVIEYHAPTGSFTTYTFAELKSGVSLGVKKLFRDSKGRIWATGLGRGLLYVDTLLKESKQVPATPGIAQQILHEMVLSIHEYKGTFYLGTWGNGLVELHIPDTYPHFQTIPFKVK